MDFNRNKYLWFAFSAILFLGLLYIADVNKFIDALESANLYLLIPALILGLSTYVIWGITWHMFFNQMEIKSGFVKTLEMFMAGNFLNSVTPLGQFGGEPFMAYIVSKNTDSSYERSLSCVVSADIVNAVPFVTFLAGGVAYLFFFSSVNNLIMQATYVSIVLGTLGGIIVYLLWFDEELLEKYIFMALDYLEKYTSFGSKLTKIAKGKITAAKSAFLEAGKNPELLLKAMLITHLTFITQIASLYFILLSLGLEPMIPAIYFTLMLAGLATFSPTPGGSGTFEAAFAGMFLLFYSVNFATALTTAILFRLMTYWPALLIGYLAFIKLSTPDRSELDSK